MKFAILADIHANRPALETVIDHIERWRPDCVIVAGDVVNRGPRPVECLRIILEKQNERGWLCIRGNHEDYVISHEHNPYDGPGAEIHSSSRWTYQQLNKEVTPLKAWPFSLSLSMRGREIRVAHASMRHNRDCVFVETPDETLREQIGPRNPAVFVVGHTHKPLIRELNGTTVVNVGSVGLPFDGDIRACYAQVVQQGPDWKAEIIRLDYDQPLADRDFAETTFMAEGGALTRLMRVELRNSISQIDKWVAAYEKAVLAGEISLDESVTRFLEAEGFKE
jgi:putative phosphoesterase